MTTHFPPLTPTAVAWKQEKKKKKVNCQIKTPKLFIRLEFKTVTAAHNLVFYALLSPLFFFQHKTNTMHT